MSDKPHILLVEDDSEQAMLFAQVLKLAQYEVVTTASAEEALAQLSASSFALLLADWDLPEMQGDALITAAKAHDPAMKTILYSNHVHVEKVAAACGADACFRKVEDIFSLRQLIKDLLANSGDCPRQ